MNWKTLITDVLNNMTQTQVASRLCRSQAWVSAVAGGKFKDLKWNEGQALIALHAEVCGANVRKAA